MPDDTFKEFVLDQLSALPEVRAQAMLGGHGLYGGDRFCGILVEGRLYIKVDESNRVAYEERGLKPFTYTKAKRVMTMNYCEVPSDILEDREQLFAWAKQSLEVSAAAGKNKPARPSKKVR